LTQSSLAFSTESSYRLISRDRVNPVWPVKLSIAA